MANSTSPVSVGWFLNPIEAQIAKGKLESEGIPAFLDTANHSTTNWPITLALGGIRLQVPPSAAQRAAEILAEVSPKGMNTEELICPSCGSSNTHRMKATWKLSILSSHILGIPLPFSSKRQHCDQCGNSWKPK